MNMSYAEFLERVINEGREAARLDYTRSDEPDKLEGSLQGFEECRGKAPHELYQLLCLVQRESLELLDENHDDRLVWRMRCRELEVNWVCNVVSAMLMNEGAQTIVPPTARGVMKAAEILGTTQ